MIGQHEHSLDAKDRITIPSRLRHELAEGAVILKGLDPCLEIWPREGYKAFTAKFLGTLNPLSSKARLMHRRFHAHAEEEVLDSAGRVRLAKHLVAHAGLEGRCVVVGVDDHLEVWNPERWAKESAEMDAEAFAAAEELAAGDLLSDDHKS